MTKKAVSVFIVAVMIFSGIGAVREVSASPATFTVNISLRDPVTGFWQHLPAYHVAQGTWFSLLDYAAHGIVSVTPINLVVYNPLWGFGFWMPAQNVHIVLDWFGLGDFHPWPGLHPGLPGHISGGVAFNHVNFPSVFVADVGDSVSFSLIVNRWMAPAWATFQGQWFRNGMLFGAAFDIEVGEPVILNFPSVRLVDHGVFVLRVTSNAGHWDVSNQLWLNVRGAPWPWPFAPPLPEFAEEVQERLMPVLTTNAGAGPGLMPLMVPPVVPAGTPAEVPARQIRAGIPALPSQNHNTVLHQIANPAYDAVFLAMRDGADVVRLYGKTLDALIEYGRPFTIVRGNIWLQMPADFILELRERANPIIGANGGTFDIYIDVLDWDLDFVDAQVSFFTQIGGLPSERFVDFYYHFYFIMDLWGAATPGADYAIFALHNDNFAQGTFFAAGGVFVLEANAAGGFFVLYSEE